MMKPENEQRSSMLLNGWWDFLPVLEEAGKSHLLPQDIPQSDWLKDVIIVPGSWTRGHDVYPEEIVQQKPWLGWRIYDNYGYPEAWDATNTAWYRTIFTVAEVQSSRRWFLHFGGILREAWIFVNGHECGRSYNGILPVECEVTKALREGSNELVVYVTDYRRDENGRCFTPVGADQMIDQMGIWQDVRLESRPDPFLYDVTIRTSVRQRRIDAIVEVENSCESSKHAFVRCTVLDNGEAFASFAGREFALLSGEQTRIEASCSRYDFHYWSPHDPHLYSLRTELLIDGAVVDCNVQRFGFREVWVDKHNIMLNGRPIRLRGEWCHKHNFDNFRPEYIRQWYGMLKDCNMNYIRTHTFPHPSVLLDIADEMGILVSVEAGWHFGNRLALDKQELWQGARQHIRDIIRRDKNHPSVILYSVGNEVRWAWDTAAIVKHVPALRKLYEELDPTRIAYHDGDSSLWDEREQQLLSRHYGLECAGEGWWDRRQPLHVGEMGKWHFGQPIDNTIFGDDEIFGSFAACHKAIALEAADIIEQGRANEVACLFPWNLSGLDNFRPWKEEHTFSVDKPNSPGIKILRSAPYGSEFTWWNASKQGYAPGISFAIIKKAFRPCAAIVREKRSRFYDDQRIRHTLTIVNDEPQTLLGLLNVKLICNGKLFQEQSQDVVVKQGNTHTVQMNIPLPKCPEPAAVEIHTMLFDKDSIRDFQTRRIKVFPADEKRRSWNLSSVMTFGSGPIAELLSLHGVAVKRVERLDDARRCNEAVLIIEKDAIQPETTQNLTIKKLLESGKRILILEQNVSPLPEVTIDVKPAEAGHIRGGQNNILAGFDADDFAWWGDDPYGKQGSDSTVVNQPYTKPATGHTRILLHSGGGDFGGGGLNWTPLFETRVGTGVALACQLRISEKASELPSARKLLRNLLQWLAEFKPAPARTCTPLSEPCGAYISRLGARIAAASDSELAILDGDVDRVAVMSACEIAQDGATALFVEVSQQTIAELAVITGYPIEAVDLGEHYHLVRAQHDGLLEGISNQETYWLDRAHYCPGTLHNRKMSKTLIRCAEANHLLVSEQNSCWREFYTLDAKSERYRMPVITWMLGNGPRDSASGLAVLPYGKGRIILCQIPMPKDPYPKADIFWTHLLGNLGVSFERTLFDGEKTVPGGRKSSGSPHLVKWIPEPRASILPEIVKSATPREYRLPNQALYSSFAWQNGICEDGTFTSPIDAKSIVIAFEVKPGKARKAVAVEGGLPNPAQQTLLNIEGEGKVTVWVNGKQFETINPGAEKKGVVADIDLEAEWNSVVLHWLGPVGANQRLKLLFRNRQQEAEVTFSFDWRI
ncbi:MAG: hypothetical protein GF398_05460 [Chitinivibrionales bacterium]|nr:hypothetical protein [Chitinivibrionales bacterium]